MGPAVTRFVLEDVTLDVLEVQAVDMMVDRVTLDVLDLVAVVDVQRMPA